MKKLIAVLFLFSSVCYADVSNPLIVTEEDSAPLTVPWAVKFPNGNVTDNGDGTTSISITSLAANGANCSAGQFPLGVDASGVSETCTVIKGTFGITIDGGGTAITTGIKGYVTVPYGMTITGWDILADTSGSIVVDVWKDTYANYPPTVADTIAGSEKPTLSTATKNQDASLSTWTTSVTAGDIIGFNVDSATTVTRVHVIIYGSKT